MSNTLREIETRIKHKIDTVENWSVVENTFIPLDGELIIYRGQTQTSGDDTSNETIHFKVGDGETLLKNLSFAYDKELLELATAISNEASTRAEEYGNIQEQLAGLKWADLSVSSTSNNNTSPTFSPDFKINVTSNSALSAGYNIAAASPIPKYSWHDILAFGANGIPTVHVSANRGESWTQSTDEDYTKKLFIQKEDQVISILNESQTAIRWTWHNNYFHACQGQYLNIGFCWVPTQARFDILFETSEDGNTWIPGFTQSDKNYTSSPRWFYINSTWAEQRYVRLTFTRTESSAVSSTASISGIKLLTARWGNQGRGSELEKPYDWDINQSIFPRVHNVSNLGADGKRWANIYGVNLHGNGSNLIALNAANISSGTLANARLNINQTAITATDRVYEVGQKSDGKLVVRVPWENTQDGNDNQTIKVENTTSFGANDCINFKAGSNINLSADRSNKTITISSTYNPPADKYHTTGSWAGLTYTATPQGDAEALTFTIPTGTSDTTVALGNHTHTGTYSLTTHNHNGVYAPINHNHNDKYILLSEKGSASGVATLDDNGLVPSSQLPSYVDDVIEGKLISDTEFYLVDASNKITTKVSGEKSKIYIDVTNHKCYRYSGTTYVEISPSIALSNETPKMAAGTAAVGTSSTAAKGDHIHPSDTSRLSVSTVEDNNEICLSNNKLHILQINGGVV